MREFDNESIRLITTFENITNSQVRDCIKNGFLYFLINAGKMAQAIGKEGANIKMAEKMLKKKIKVFEYSDNVQEFVKNLVPQAQKIEVSGEKAIIKVNSKDKGIVIGKAGSNIKVLREFLERNSNVKELEIK